MRKLREERRLCREPGVGCCCQGLEAGSGKWWWSKVEAG